MPYLREVCFEPIKQPSFWLWRRLFRSLPCGLLMVYVDKLPSTLARHVSPSNLYLNGPSPHHQLSYVFFVLFSDVHHSPLSISSINHSTYSHLGRKSPLHTCREAIAHRMLPFIQSGSSVCPEIPFLFILFYFILLNWFHSFPFYHVT